MNYVPTTREVSDYASPKTIMTGETLDYMKDPCLKPGEDCQVHEDELPRNRQRARNQ